jgi:FlaA1/EpsC-like NDP-sugar epimerase
MRGVRFKVLPACASLAEPVSAAMLDDLAPEDLLPRPPVAPDRGAVRRGAAGRRVLVTGAAAGLGAELCRQLVHHGVRQIVMLDEAEDALYARGKRLAREQPEADVRVEVADRRDAAPLARLLERYRPDYVFHAPPGARAAQREEAADGLGGALELARAADACGARRFVLVSCEAAGAQGEAAPPSAGRERLLRDLARCTRLKVTAVRLGEVPGPGGSLLRLLDDRPAPPRRGDAARRERERTPSLMTVPEAAGLVLLAGVGDGGEPRLPNPAEPVPPDELARLAVALSGSGTAAG